MSRRVNRKGVATVGVILTSLVMVASFLLVFSDFVPPVLAEHDVTITISPNIANCGQLGQTFTVNIANDPGIFDDIFEVRIYNGTGSLSNFSCGPAPHGWDVQLDPYGYCDFETERYGPYVIEPGENLNFTFDATMISTACNTTFEISTLDNAQPGSHEFRYPVVDIDCTPPLITKILGTPNVSCDPQLGCDYWVTEQTLIELWASDDQDPNHCDQGIKHCKWRVTLDGVPGDWNYEQNGPIVNWDFNLQNDSNHLIEVECVDIANNMALLNEKDKVDDTPPVTTKEFVGPKKIDPVTGAEWIDGITEINLSYDDPDPTGQSCNIGVDATYWRLTNIGNNPYCYQPSLCKPCPEESCGDWNTYTGPIKDIDESCHLLEYRSIDKLGNEEDINVNCFFVDKSAPNVTKVHGTPAIDDYDPAIGNFTWLTPETDITFTCTDPEPHPAGDEELCFQVGYDLQGDITTTYCSQYGGVMDEGFCCLSATPAASFVFNFNENEDSVHNLTYFCQDAVEKKSNEETQWYKVDSTPPNITAKLMVGSWLGDCPPKTPSDICYVSGDGNSGVEIWIQDGGPICAVDNIDCNYEVWWEDISGHPIDSGKFSNYVNITFTQDSRHDLIVWCEDELGNAMDVDNETFYVDALAPETTKDYGEPYVTTSFGYPEWINSSTEITLTPNDEKVGPDQTFFTWGIVSDYYCEHPENCHSCQNCSYALYQGPFTISDQSCHRIQFYSTDKLGHVEEPNHQCVYVDNTTPTMEMIVGDPHMTVPNETYTFVTMNTPITLTCVDPTPHPVHDEEIFWRFSNYSDAFQTLVNYTQWYSQVGNEVIVKFQEDSWHDLEYYCVDGLGNSNDVTQELFIVETVAPNTTKTYSGPFYQKEICPGANQSCYYQDFIDTVTEVVLTPEDPEPHPSGLKDTMVAVSLVSDYYCEHPDNCAPCDEEKDGECGEFLPYADPFTIPESCHVIEFYSVDNLENTEEPVNYQCVFADHTKPVTTSEISQPVVIEGNSTWISDQSEFTLMPTDPEPHPSGVNKTEYRITLMGSDDPCLSQSVCDQAEGSKGWTTYQEGQPFNIPEESCHLVEYFSTDNVNKIEDTNKECVFVDLSSPDPLKTVGEPKDPWTPGLNGDLSATFYPEANELCNDQGNVSSEMECWEVTTMTPITLDCEDQLPHPVNSEEVCYQVGWNGEDKTEEYCNNSGGTMFEGYCCLEEEKAPVTFTFTEECEHKFDYYCTDALGNQGPGDTEYFKVEGQAFNITINKKWNLISTPFTLMNDTPENTFKDIEHQIDSVWTFNGSEWFVYSPDGIENDNLKHIIPGWGYWVLALEDTTFIIGGDDLSPTQMPPTRELVYGWNLVGEYRNKANNESDPGHIGSPLFSYNGPVQAGRPTLCTFGTLKYPNQYPQWETGYAYWQPDADPWKDLQYHHHTDPGAGYWLEVQTNRPEKYTFSANCAKKP